MNKHVVAAPRDNTPRAASAHLSRAAHGYTARDTRFESAVATQFKTRKDARDIVLSFLTALNSNNLQKARTFTAENMTFSGVLGSRNGADAYFRDMERMRLKYTIKKIFSDSHEVCVFYDLTIADTTIFGCGWYHVENGKICSLRVVFDPRPVLDSHGHH